MDMPPYDIISWDDAPSRPIRPYHCLDLNGVEMKMQPKNPANHQSPHPMHDDPALFYNLKIVVSEPDLAEESVSQNPAAISNRQKGKVVVYSKSNLLSEINFPSNPSPDTEVKVVVLYPHDGTTPYSLTYRIGP